MRIVCAYSTVKFGGKKYFALPTLGCFTTVNHNLISVSTVVLVHMVASNVWEQFYIAFDTFCDILYYYNIIMRSRSNLNIRARFLFKFIVFSNTFTTNLYPCHAKLTTLINIIIIILSV